MGGFGYHADIVERFPGVRGSVTHASGLENRPSPPDLLAAYETEQARVIGEIGDSPLSAIPSLEAWRRAFSSFGVKPTQYRSAAEALLRRLTKQGDIPSINTLVDIANLISIRYRIPVAVCDQRAVTGLTTVRFATGEERFTDLGSGETSHPDPGEVVFVDDDLLASARRGAGARASRALPVRRLWRRSSPLRPSTQMAKSTSSGRPRTCCSSFRCFSHNRRRLTDCSQLSRHGSISDPGNRLVIFQDPQLPSADDD